MTPIQETRGFLKACRNLSASGVAGVPFGHRVSTRGFVDVDVLRQCGLAQTRLLHSDPQELSRKPQSSEAHTAAMRPRILVVEDEENVAFVVRTAATPGRLRHDRDHHRRDALQVVCAEEAFDLIVLDVMLPDLDGFEYVDAWDLRPF